MYEADTVADLLRYRVILAAGPRALGGITGKGDPMDHDEIKQLTVKELDAMRLQGVELTAVELEALTDAADGFTVPESAQRQFRSVETIKTHRKHAMAKLGARNTCHAIALALRKNLLHPIGAE